MPGSLPARPWETAAACRRIPHGRECGIRTPSPHAALDGWRAWQWAQGYCGDSRASLLVGLGGIARAQARESGLEPQAKADLLEIAGKAMDLALDTQSEMPEAMAVKALFLREDANETADLATKTSLMAESARLAQAAYAIYQKSHPDPAPAAP